jgi:hypothetical protein
MSGESPVRIFPARLTWPAAVTDAASIPNETRKVRLLSGFTGWERLQQLSQLHSLWSFGVNQQALSDICGCVALENLYIENLKAGEFGCLRELRSLQILSIESCPKIDSLAELSNLRNLTGLAIIHFKNLHDVGPLSALTELRELAIAGSMWTRMKIRSLQPIASLGNLKYLHLTNLKVADESLRPLGNLSRLETLEIANFYPMEEFAWLSGKLRDAECIWFRPFLEVRFKKCPKCGGDAMVMLTGKGKPILCKECDRKRLDQHVAQFGEIAANSA